MSSASRFSSMITGVAIQAKGACCAGADIHDARTVAGRLGIPHYVLDYESRFHDQVMQDFADSYMRGETPIPCVRCNQTVKFTDLLTTARDLGADCLATGHYVQRIDAEEGLSSTAAAIRPRTSPISCLRPRRTSLTICASRLAG